MIRLTVHEEAALLHCPELLQSLMQLFHCLLDTLPLHHRHLTHTEGHTHTDSILFPKEDGDVDVLLSKTLSFIKCAP